MDLSLLKMELLKDGSKSGETMMLMEILLGMNYL